MGERKSEPERSFLQQQIIILKSWRKSMMKGSRNEDTGVQKIISGNGENHSMMIDGSRSSSSHGRSVINQLISNDQPKVNPLECSKEDQFLFDRFVRCKQEDKPKDTLAWISFKKMQFLQYVNANPLAKDDSGAYESGGSNEGLNPSMRRLYECTILRQIDQGALLVVRVRASQQFKCNIIVSDFQGTVVKYFPNALLIKKREKIIKIASEYNKNSLFVIDFTLPNPLPLFFTPFFRKYRPLAYCLMDLPPDYFELCLPELSELAQTKKLHFSYSDNKLRIASINHCKQSFPEVGSADLYDRVLEMLREEDNFLLEFRGAKEQKEKNIELDLLGVSLWRRGKSGAREVVDTINKLYKMKEEAWAEESRILLTPSSDIHVPFKTNKEQNCAFCLSNFPSLKPKRTSSICKACSAQKQKPFYLCRKCFQAYHKHPHVHIYKKHQKKTKRLIKLNRRKMNQGSQQVPKAAGVQTPEQNAEEVKKKQALQRFKKLDRLTDEFFGKIDELIQEKGEDNLKSCEFYLNMMLNNNIKFIETLFQKEATQTQEIPSHGADCT